MPGGPVWAIAALPRPPHGTGFGGTGPEVSVKGWEGCHGVEDWELTQICLPKASFSLGRFVLLLRPN